MINFTRGANNISEPDGSAISTTTKDPASNITATNPLPPKTSYHPNIQSQNNPEARWYILLWTSLRRIHGVPAHHQRHLFCGLYSLGTFGCWRHNCVVLFLHGFQNYGSTVQIHDKECHFISSGAWSLRLSAGRWQEKFDHMKYGSAIVKSWVPRLSTY